jgi:hypothetical protein
MTDTSKRGLQALAVAGLVAAAGVAVLVVRTTPPQPSAVAARPHVVPPPAADTRGLIETYLRGRANDPASVQIQSVVYGTRDVEDGVPTQLARVQYREKNVLGATVFRDLILRIENGRTVTHGEWERNFLAIAGTVPWSPDPAGP